MRLNTINQTAWQQFTNQFPEAYNFLLHHSLKGEYRALKIQTDLNAWEVERLTELEILKEYWSQE